MDKRAWIRRVTCTVLTLALISMMSIPSKAIATARRPQHQRSAVPPHAAKAGSEARTRVRDAYAASPLRFELTGAKGGDEAEFDARGGGFAVGLARGNATIAVGSAADRREALVTLRLANASPRTTAAGRDLLPGVTNYVVGNDPRRWRTGVRSYARVEYSDVYDGVNIVYYGTQRQLEYDFVVAPRANYRQIALTFDNASHVHIEPTGDLIIATTAGDLVQHAPAIYQETDRGRRSVRGGYVRRGRERVGFWVGQHDPNLPLVIDPVLTYATYLGGANEERAGGVATDAQGNVYLAGMTGASDFPVAATPDLQHGRNNWDAFVIKLNAAGDQLVYATYLGGSGYEEPADLDVDAAGNAYVIGGTDSRDFPTLHAIQPSFHGVDDCFVAKLDASGALLYSSYLGGKDYESAGGLAVDRLGRAYVTGNTWSPDFPTANAFQPALGGSPAFRSTDGGVTWVGIPTGLRATSVLTFAIDPAHTSTVYAGTASDGVFKSTDGGMTWMATSADLPPFPVNALAVDLQGTVFVGNDASLYRSQDGGATWTDAQLWTRISSLAVDPATSAVYAGASGSYYRDGVFKTTDGGATWTDTGLGTGANSVTVSQSIVYAGTSYGVFKRTGVGWEATAGPYDTVTALAANPSDPNEVYAGTYNGLFHTTSGGADWPAVDIWGPAPVVNIAMAPSSPTTVYVATYWGSGMTDDGGATWRQTGPGNSSFCFAVDPLVYTTVYSGGSVASDIFIARISTDGGTLEYSTYLGGTMSEWASDIAIDGDGAAYVTGTTQSTDFPVLNPFQSTAGDLMDVFVAKLSETGTLVYGTYLGGWGSDYNARIAVDAAGQAHVVGITLSPNFPVANAYQPALGGGYTDVFVTTLNAAGNGLVFSTYLGGNDQEVDWGPDLGPGVAVGPLGETVVSGTTWSHNFPMRNAVQPAYGGGRTDAFVASFDSAGQMQYSTYLGGSGEDYGGRVAFDSTGSVVVMGSTMSNDFPTHGALQSTNAGVADVFVARIANREPDLVPPTIAISSPAAADYLHTDSIQVSFSAMDSGSGLASGSPSATLDGVAVASGQTIQPLTLALGSHIFTVAASDQAGNIATQTVDFRVTATIDSLIATVNIFTNRRQIDATAARILLAKLSDAKEALTAGDVSGARAELQNFESMVSMRSGETITEDAAQILLGDADYVLSSL